MHVSYRSFLFLVELEDKSYLTRVDFAEKNIELKEEIERFHNEYERGVLEGVDDYTSMIIDLLKTCQPVTLQSSKGSATVVDTACFNK